MEGSELNAGEQNLQSDSNDKTNLDSEIMSEWEKRLEGLK
jgi:hypothetical protein